MPASSKLSPLSTARYKPIPLQLSPRDRPSASLSASLVKSFRYAHPETPDRGHPPCPGGHQRAPAFAERPAFGLAFGVSRQKPPLALHPSGPPTRGSAPHRQSTRAGFSFAIERPRASRQQSLASDAADLPRQSHERARWPPSHRPLEPSDPRGPRDPSPREQTIGRHPKSDQLFSREFTSNRQLKPTFPRIGIQCLTRRVEVSTERGST